MPTTASISTTHLTSHPISIERGSSLRRALSATARWSSAVVRVELFVDGGMASV